MSMYHQKLSLQIKQISTPFASEEMLYNDKEVVLLTGLPNFKILKALFDHVVKTMPVEGTGKLSLFQQFTCYLMKLRLNWHPRLMCLLQVHRKYF